MVSYGTTSGGPYPFTATGSSDSYTYNAKYTSGLIHHVTLTGLRLNTPYFYVLGAPGAQSTEAYFNSSRGVGAVYPYTLAAIGDLGESKNAQNTVTHLQNGFDHIDAINFNGDISYASGCEGKSGCTTWDALQRMMEPVTQTIPTSIEIGNRACARARSRRAGRSRRRWRRACPPTPRRPLPLPAIMQMR